MLTWQFWMLLSGIFAIVAAVYRVADANFESIGYQILSLSFLVAPVFLNDLILSFLNK